MKVFVSFLIIAMAMISSNAFGKVIFSNTKLNFNDFSGKVDLASTKLKDELTRSLYEVEVQVRPDKIVKKITEVWYFPSINDIKSYGKTSIYYNEPVENLKIIKVATIMEDNNIYNLSKDDTKILESNTYDVFTSQKELLITFPKLQPVGFTYLQYEITINKKELEYDWSEEFFPLVYFRTDIFAISIDWSAGLKPNIFANIPSVECVEESQSMKCTANNLPPAILDKNFYSADELKTIQVGELESWQQVVNSASKKFASAYSDSDIFESFIDNNISLDMTQEEKISYLHSYVARNIRYLSDSEHGHAVTPHKTIDTMERSLGDCKDKTALFIDLVGYLGLDAYPVLVATDREKNDIDNVPSLMKFNHVIACYRYKGNEYCSDLTDTETHWKNISSWIQGKYALRLLDDEKPFLLGRDEYQWKNKVSTEVVFNEDGGQVERQERVYDNLYSSWLRSKLNVLNKQQQQMWLMDHYQQTVSDKGDSEIKIAGLGSMSEKIVVNTSTTYPSFFNVDEELEYFESDAWLLDAINDSYINNKYYGYHTKGAAVESSYVVDTTGLWHFSIRPSDLDLHHRYGSLERSSSISKEGKLMIETRLSLPSKYIPASEIEEYTKFLDVLKSQVGIRFFGDVRKKS